MDISHVIIAVLGGLIAGGINTLAGNGSIITLTILTEVLCLSGNVANGTNRLGVLLNSAGSVFGFRQSGIFKLEKHWAYTIPVLLGALVGIALALAVSNEQFLQVFKYMMVILFVFILVNPKRWLILEKAPAKIPYPLLIVLLFLLGIYGGFIQMGMGLLFLGIMVLGAGYPLMQSNVFKAFIILLYTLAAVALFEWKGLIDWKMGFLLGLGQLVGGWLTSKYGSRINGIEKWAYRLLIITVLIAIIKVFNIHLFIFSFL